MELAVFAVLVVLVGLLGVGLGLAVAPRLAAWEDRRARSHDEDPGPAPVVDEGGEGGEGGD